MSTRSIIAKGTPDEWEGVYHHWDGYPSGLGVELVHLHDGFFDGDFDAMTTRLVDDEPVGWSSIVGADFSLPSCFYEDPGKQPRQHGPLSYSARGEENALRFTNRDAGFAGAEWLYVLTPEGIYVFEGDVGMFGYGGGNFRSPVLVEWGNDDKMGALESSYDEVES